MDKEKLDSAELQEGYFAKVHYSEIQSLEFNLLLLGDLAFTEPKQRRAYRQMVRKIIWFNWAANLADRSDPTVPVGMPEVEAVEID